MPHRKNAKGDIGTLKTFSSTYDMDNVYLSEEGWVYRHFKNTERTLWWDEILIAGQVKPTMSIHGVPNTPVCETNPVKLGTVADPVFEVGDGYNDYRYSDHAFRVYNSETPAGVEKIDTLEKHVVGTDPKDDGFDQIPWIAINVSGEVDGQPPTQIPAGWNQTDTIEGWTDPSDPTSDEPPYPGDSTQGVTEYTIHRTTPAPIPPEILVGEYESGAGGGLAGDVPYPADDTAGSSADKPEPNPNPEPGKPGGHTASNPVQLLPIGT